MSALVNYSWWQWDKSIATITAKIGFIWRLSLPQGYNTPKGSPHHFWTAIPSLSLCCFKSTDTFSFGFFFLLFFPLGSGEADWGLSFRLFFLSGGWSLLGVSSAAETLPCLKQRQGVQSSCRDGEKEPLLPLPSFKLLCTCEWEML